MLRKHGVTLDTITSIQSRFYLLLRFSLLCYSVHRKKLAALSKRLHDYFQRTLAFIHFLHRLSIIWRYKHFTGSLAKNFRPEMPPELIIAAELDITVIEGRNLVAKDGATVLALRPNTMSDPYVVVRIGRRKIGLCPVKYKTLNPKWNKSFAFNVENRYFSPDGDLLFSIMDKDADSFDDPMGEVHHGFSILMIVWPPDSYLFLRPS